MSRGILAELFDLGTDKDSAAVRMDAHAVDIVVEGVTIFVELAGLDNSRSHAAHGILLTGVEVEMGIKSTAEGELSITGDALAVRGARRCRSEGGQAEERGSKS